MPRMPMPAQAGMASPMEGVSMPAPVTSGATRGFGGSRMRMPGFGPQRMARYAKGTKGKPAPLNTPIIVGDSKNGKENAEVVIATKEGVHVEPVKNLQKCEEGTGTLTKRRPRIDGRTIVTKPAPKPISGLAQFQVNNPTTPTAAQREMKKIDQGQATKMPVPSLGSKPPKRYAEGTGTMDLQQVGWLMRKGKKKKC